ncbi:MAG: T9SS type A sorting domain-containing protein [Bacteroidetes bacterium]|nr:T9SS type A sorting domain-containing protein [Bacteroidota bacterium]
MKIFNSLLLFLSAINLSFPQLIVLQEDFTNYQATTQTIPTGWTFSYQGNYTTTTFSGSSGPNSYKFGGANTTTINTPPFLPGADSVKFWIKGSGTDTLSQLIILESVDSLKWDTLTKICPVPTMAAKGKRSFPVKPLSTHLRFKYIKSVGNLAFDDFKLTTKNLTATQYYPDQLSFSVYPNPSVDGQFTIRLRSINTTGTITISNTWGEIIKIIESTQEAEYVDLSGMLPGIYFVNVTQGSLSGTRKAILY